MGQKGAESSLGILATRVGRRFVLMFLGCALLPLAVFAVLASSKVSGELSRQTELQLHDAAKTAGMGLAARLSQMQVDVQLMRNHLLAMSDAALIDAPTALADALGERYRSMTLYAARGVESIWGEVPSARPRLSPIEEKHLASDKLLLCHVGSGGHLGVAALENPADPDSGLLLGELRQDWLWDAQELRSRGSEVLVFDGACGLLFSTLPGQVAVGPVVDAVAKSPASGSVEWVVGAEVQLARYWRAFLRPQYGMDLVVVQTRPKDIALAAVSGFHWWFSMTALGSLFLVSLLGLVQMRRTLEPILVLSGAVRRVGGGNFAERVTISSDDEFGDLGAAFNDMAGQLAANVQERERAEQELLAAKDAALMAARAKVEFLTNVSHELRTPMAEILGATEILLTYGGDDAAAREEFTSIAFRGAKRLSGMLDDVLDLGSDAHWAIEAVDLGATLRMALSDQPAAVAERIVLAIPVDLPKAAAVGLRLVDTWRRLIDNAVKFTRDESAIEVCARAGSDTLIVEFQDRGVGIAAVDHERIFEPFQQVGRDQLIDKASGTGLGLTIVRSTVMKLGGRIEVESALGEGATFRVILPMATPGMLVANAPEAAPAIAH